MNFIRKRKKTVNKNQTSAKTLMALHTHTHTHTGRLEVYFSYKKINIEYIKTHIIYVENST